MYKLFYEYYLYMLILFGPFINDVNAMNEDDMIKYFDEAIQQEYHENMCYINGKYDFNYEDDIDYGDECKSDNDSNYFVMDNDDYI